MSGYTREELGRDVPTLHQGHERVRKSLTEKLDRAVHPADIEAARTNLREFETYVARNAGATEILDEPTLPPEATLSHHHTAEEADAWRMFAPKVPGR